MPSVGLEGAPLLHAAFAVSCLRRQPIHSESLSMKLLLCGLVAAALLVDPGCKRGRDASKPTVAYVTNGIANFWKIAEKGARDAAADPKIAVNGEVAMPPTAVE